MSSEYYVINGWGFDIDAANINPRSKAAEFAAFLKKHKPELLPDLSLDENSSDDEIYEALEVYDSCYGDESPWALIGDVITSETGIRVTYFCGNEFGEAIMLEDCLPWLFNEKERDITEEQLTEIFVKYLKELNIEIETPSLYLDRCAIRYFG